MWKRKSLCDAENDSAMNEPKNKNIKQTMARDDRPREKAMDKGFEALSVAELLAVIIGSGTPGENVVDLCQRLLHEHDNKLYLVARRSFRDLMRNFKGIGEVKAVQILAALELARRYQTEEFGQRPTINDSKAAYQYLRNGLDHLDHEEIHILLLNRAHQVIGRERISSGGTAMTVGDVKMILKPAIEQMADSLILSHNHPSDNPRPSDSDNDLTKRVKQACQVMGIQLMDHIVVCRGNLYYSYADHGKL